MTYGEPLRKLDYQERIMSSYLFNELIQDVPKRMTEYNGLQEVRGVIDLQGLQLSGDKVFVLCYSIMEKNVSKLIKMSDPKLYFQFSFIKDIREEDKSIK